jgi:dTDP-4-dehydrorhamnose reductase
MRVVVVGANGQLGTDVVAAFAAAGHHVTGLTHDHIEVSDEAQTRDALASQHPDVVVNTAAMHNVEACEDAPASAFAINGLGAWNVARACRDVGARLIHISTDYVFDGAMPRPYVETDAPRPLNVYGVTKLAGEHLALATGDHVAVVRSSGLYGTNPCRAKGGLNFVQLMLKLGRERGEVRVVADERVSPTHTEALAGQLLSIANAGATGLFHATSQGECSWHEFAVSIFREAGMEVTVHRAEPGEFPQKVARPQFSVLDNQRLRQLGIDVMPAWDVSLRQYMAQGVAV